MYLIIGDMPISVYWKSALSKTKTGLNEQSLRKFHDKLDAPSDTVDEVLFQSSYPEILDEHMKSFLDGDEDIAVPGERGLVIENLFDLVDCL
ncbi:MAG: hypothetical protein IJ228_07500 [Succinivibrio sp.]|nr:hypothetical protein [Succinivibrio sp.]